MCVDCEREVIADLREDAAELRQEIANLTDKNDLLRQELMRRTKQAEDFYIDRAKLRRELKIAKDVMRQSEDDEAKDRERMKRMKRELDDAKRKIAKLCGQLRENTAKAAKLDNLANVLRSVVD